jgi:hypothetical protein
MIASPLSAGDRVRIRPTKATSDIYGRVSSVHNQAAAVECSERDRSATPLQSGDEVEVAAFGPADLRLFSARVLADTGAVVVLSIPPVTRMMRSRGGYRKPCDIPACYHPVDRPYGTLDARIEDLSIGGLLMACESRVESGAHLVIQFSLPHCKQHEVEVTVEVVRVIPGSAAADGKARVGCVFTSASRLAIARLAQFVQDGEGGEDNQDMPPPRLPD